MRSCYFVLFLLLVLVCTTACDSHVVTHMNSQCGNPHLRIKDPFWKEVCQSRKQVYNVLRVSSGQKKDHMLNEIGTVFHKEDIRAWRRFRRSVRSKK